MAAFEYIALDSDGRRTKGVISADTARSARRELRLRQLIPVEIDVIRGEDKDQRFRLRGRLSDKDRAVLTRQLAVLLQSGMQIDQVLAIAANDANKPETRKILAGIHAQVTEGTRFADALGSAPRAFPSLYRAIASAGEQSGRLGEVMERLAIYLENTYRMRRKVQAALVYPALLGVMAFVMMGALMVFVVPRLVEQFDTFGTELPWLTRQVIAMSDFVRGPGWILLVAIVIAGLVLWRAMKIAALKYAADQASLRLPVLGPMVRTVSAARFARIFATLSGSGATVLESLGAAKSAMTNSLFAEASDTIAERVREGGSFAAALKSTGVFPKMMVHMVASGEQGRDLPGMMTRAADFLEADFETSTATLLSLMEPLIIILLGVIVGLIVLAIMLPIIQLNTLALT